MGGGRGGGGAKTENHGKGKRKHGGKARFRFPSPQTPCLLFTSSRPFPSLYKNQRPLAKFEPHHRQTWQIKSWTHPAVHTHIAYIMVAPPGGEGGGRGVTQNKIVQSVKTGLNKFPFFDDLRSPIFKKNLSTKQTRAISVSQTFA